MNPTWAKGYARKGAALHGQRRYVEAIEAYELGLKIEDSPAIRKGLDEVKAAKGALDFCPPATFSLDRDSQHCDHAEADERGDGADAMGIGNMFSDPGMFAKLAANPRTAKHLADASFMQKVCTPPSKSAPRPPKRFHFFQLQLIQKNPQLAQSLLSSDPRMIDVLGALMGLDMQGFSRPEGSDEVPPGVPQSAASPPSSPPPSAKPTPAASSSKVHEPEDVKMAEADEEDNEDAAAKKAAEAEKKLGADAYKKRDFATAITHFSKAWETWPKDITFLTNLAGECIGL